MSKTTTAPKPTAAEELVAKRAEHAEVRDVTLPNAYRSLGKEIYEEGNFKRDFEKLFADIAAGLANAETATGETESLREQLNRAFASLGKAAYELHGQSAGPVEIVTPISYDLVRLALLEGEIVEIEQAHLNAPSMKRRVAVAACILLALGFVVVSPYLFSFGETDRPKSEASGDTASSADSTKADGDSQRLAVPDKESLQQAAQLVENQFGAEIAAARSTEARNAIIEKMRRAAAAPDSTPALRYALLEAERNLRADATTAMKVIEETANTFEIDTFREKATTVWRMSKSAQSTEQKTAVASVAAELMDQASESENYDVALKLGDMALDAARQSNSPEMLRQLRGRTDRVRSQRRVFNEVETALAQLNLDPRDAEANRVVGQYRCLVKGDWKRGLPNLMLCDHPELKELAIQELRHPSSSTAQAALADGWFALATKTSASTKRAMLARSQFWYLKALESKPAVSPNDKARIEGRLADISNR